MHFRKQIKPVVASRFNTFKVLVEKPNCWEGPSKERMHPLVEWTNRNYYEAKISSCTSMEDRLYYY